MLAVALLVALPVPLAGQRRAMTVEDLLAVRTPSDARISPDGRVIAFTVSQPSLQDDANVSRIWVVGADGSGARPLTDGPGSDRAPRWAPDGRSVAFISTRDGTPQVWRMGVTGGDAEKVSTIAGGVQDFQWARDGTALYIVADTRWPGVGEAQRRGGAYPTEARIWTDLMYRHWDEWRVGVRRHLFRLALDGGRVTDLVPIDRDVPTLALGGADVAQSPPGTELAVAFNPDEARATSTNNDIFVMGPEGSARQAITTNPANDHSPTYSPDGRYLAFLAAERPGFESDRQRIALYERATGRVAPLTGEWDRSVAAITWLAPQQLVAEVTEAGEQRLYTVAVPGGRPSLLVSGGTNRGAVASPDGTFLVFVRESAAAPPELYRVDATGRGLRRLTALNVSLAEELDLATAESFGVAGSGGADVQGWVVRPPAFNERTRYPVLHLVHGGPQSAWLDQWHPRWNYQLFAARGYVVVATNFAGSTGAGQAFTNAVSRNWGGAPYEDLMATADWVARQRWADTARMGAAGASYGGYMVYWMAGQSNRYKAFAAQSGIFNPLSFSGTTEELWFPIWEFGGTPLSPPARATMEKWSPANFASRWTAPMLVIHGQQDARVDISESYQAFTAARLRGLPAKFLYFPDEGHWITGPRNRRLWWGVVLDWFDQWLREGT